MRVKYLPQDHGARLNGGICFFKGHPYLLYIAGDNVHAELRLLTSPKKQGSLVELSSLDLDISSPPLGYINYNGSSFYMMRTPERRYKQLVEPATLSGQECGVTKPSMMDTNAMVLSRSGEEMFLGLYPTLKQALALIETRKVKAIAIHRHIALCMDSFGIIRVYYKNKEAGRIRDSKLNVVHVPSGELAWVVSKYLDGYDWVVQ